MRRGFVVMGNLAGHGIGRHLHESPDHVPDFGRSKDRSRFQNGMVLTLEPFLSTGPRQARSTNEELDAYYGQGPLLSTI